MGLDISHTRATTQITPNFVSADDYHDPDMPFEWFAAYAQPIEHDKVSEQLVLIGSGLSKHLSKAGTRAFHGKRTYPASVFPNYHLDTYGHTRYVMLAEGEDLEARMRAVEQDYLANLAKAHSSVVKFGEKIVEVPGRGRYGILTFGKHLAFRGFYWETVGEQRKGVTAAFWDNYGPEGGIYHLAEAERMLTTIQPELRQHFKTHFVDNFVEGASLISWAG